MSSSARTLVFKPLFPNEVWTAGNERVTLLVRRTDHGFAAFVQKWSGTLQAYTIDPIPPAAPAACFAERDQAESACQARYEQELRWMPRRSSILDVT